MRLTGSGGSIEAAIGDQFTWHDGTIWEIVGFTGQRIYSPSGIGGAPIVQCRHVGGDLNPMTHRWVDADGLCDWCGDSVAVALIRAKIERDGGGDA